MVSPPGLEPFSGRPLGYEASITGDRIAFYTKYGAPSGSPSFGPYFLSTRGHSGWSTEDVIPPQTTAGGDFCNPSIIFSPDLSNGVLQDGWNWGEGYPRYLDDNGSNNCSHDEPALVAGEPRGAQNLFLRDNDVISYQLINTTPPGVSARDAWFQSASTDFSHIVFTDPIPLTPEAPVPPDHAIYKYSVGEDIYEWVEGILRLVTILPDGTPTWGLLVNADDLGHQGTAVFTHAVSSDGERVFFYAGGEAFGPEEEAGKAETYVGGGLYLRENAAREQSSIAAGKCSESTKACTVQIDMANSNASGSSGSGHFQWATPDGSKVFFTDDSRLTADSTAEVGKPDLYEYDLEKPEGQRLADLTVSVTESASVQGLSGISDDGSYVYFVAEGNLTGEQANSQGEEARIGKPNLYLHHAGHIIFIASLDALGEDSQEGAEEGDTCDWESYIPPGGIGVRDCMSARVTPGGTFLAFNSLRSLTGYDNTVVGASERNHEIFLYEATQDELSCASCDPGGAPPTAEARGEEDPRIERPTHEEQWYRTPGYLGHNLSDTGQVFFSTQNQLLPGAINGLINVYEYKKGELSLITTGTSSDDSFFRDASASGDDVFFITTQALVGFDMDNTLSLYDARVDGGFAEQPPPPPACDDEETCHGSVSTSLIGPLPPSAVFVGPGNLVPPPPNKPGRKIVCKKGFRKVKFHGKTVCKKVPRHHKRKGHARHVKRGAHK